MRMGRAEGAELAHLARLVRVAGDLGAMERGNNLKNELFLVTLLPLRSAVIIEPFISTTR